MHYRLRKEEIMKNKELENLLEKMQQEGTQKYMQEFFGILSKSTVVVPAVLPKNTSPEAMKRILSANGKNQPLPEGVNPQPCLLSSPDGKQFMPLFTSEEEMHKGAQVQNAPLSLNVPFEICTRMVSSMEGLEGIVVNPFSHNIIFRAEIKLPPDIPEGMAQGNVVPGQVLNQEGEPEEIELTPEQYHFVSRQRMESTYFPMQLFEKKGELVKRISAEQGECLKELYQEIYDGELACPYFAEEFDVMALNIRENLTIVQVAMPEKNLRPKTCSSVMIGWNPQTDKIWYYAVLRGNSKQNSRLMRVMEDNSKVDMGDAPAEGNEISGVLELIDKEQAQEE